MNILIDIGHPAHVHYFKHLFRELKLNHRVSVTCRNVPVVTQLLAHYNIPYTVIGSKADGILRKAANQVRFVKRLTSEIKKLKIDLAIGSSATAVHAAKLTGIDSILFDDDDQNVQPITAKFVSPYAKCIVSPNSLEHEHLKNAIYYPGFQELAYLHPQRFIPDSQVLKKYGLGVEEKYFILRFNAFKAHHDVHEGGMSQTQKGELIELMSGHGRVFITTEAVLDPEFKLYQMPILPWEMHDFLAFSQMLISDSQTMTSEAAILGVPSFRCNSFVGRISGLEEEEKRYGMTRGFLPNQFSWMLESIEQMIVMQRDKQYWKDKQERMLKDKIDVSSFWLWLINNYPDSVREAKKEGFNYSRFY